MACAAGPLPLLAEGDPRRSLSLAMTTDDPEEAIESLQKALGEGSAFARRFTFREAILPGTQEGDIVLVRDGKLIDFRASRDPLSRRLRDVAGRFRLPRRMEDPLLVLFESCSPAGGADHVEIYHRNALVARFGIKDTVVDHEVRTGTGSLLVSLRAGVARITEATCAHRTCVKAGGIHRAGQALVCIPDEVRVVVTGRDGHGIDSVAF